MCVCYVSKRETSKWCKRFITKKDRNEKKEKCLKWEKCEMKMVTSAV